MFYETNMELYKYRINDVVMAEDGTVGVIKEYKFSLVHGAMYSVESENGVRDLYYEWELSQVH